MKRYQLLLAAWLGLVPPLASDATEPEFRLEPVFTVLEENDMVVKTDRHYTQGIKLSYFHRDGAMPQWMHRLSQAVPTVGFDERVARFGLQLGQNIYTPANTRSSAPLPDDRPYAGWLYAGFALHRKGLIAQRWPTLESLEVQLGVIGPESLAEQAQTWVHEVRGIDEPNGWRHQLDTEPGIALRYWRGARLIFSPQTSRRLDFIPHFAGSLGNIETSVRLGGTLRAGYNLPPHFGQQSISSLLSSEGGWPAGEPNRYILYGFIGVEGWAVGYTAFLDGNLFQDSLHVRRQVLVGELRLGFAVGFRHVEAGFAYVYRSKEFIGQKDNPGYGAVSVKMTF